MTDLQPANCLSHALFDRRSSVVYSGATNGHLHNVCAC